MSKGLANSAIGAGGLAKPDSALQAAKGIALDTMDRSPSRPVVTDLYEFVSNHPLGRGCYGQVFLMRNRKTGVEVAAKRLDKHKNWSIEKFRLRVAEEVTALQHTKHRNVIELIDHLPDAQQEDRYWVLMKYARGGHLLDRVIQRHHNHRPYTEEEVSKITYDILFGLKHLHDRHIVHCDIKPDNILFESTEDDSNLVLVDMGFATLCERGSFLDKMRGTLEYMAPEVLTPGPGGERLAYDSKADVWSVGCVLYTLLSGELPFRRAWDKNISQQEFNKRVKFCITQVPINLSTGAWERVTDGAKRLVGAMLSRDPGQRPSAHQCLENEWFRGAAPSTGLPREVLEELSKFNTARGNQSYASHSLSGLVTSLASGSAIASISGQHTASSAASVNILQREGGIQPLITEGYSDDDARRSQAIFALANLAGKKERQEELVSAGLVRLLSHLATCPLSSQGELKSELQFNTARAWANLTEDASLRRCFLLPQREGQVVVEAVTRLAWEALACPTPTFRVVIQASRALGQIAKERHLLTALLDPSCLMHVDQDAPARQGPLRAAPIWFVMLLASPKDSTNIKCQEQFRCEAHSLLLSILAAAQQQGGLPGLRELAKKLGRGVSICAKRAMLCEAYAPDADDRQGSESAQRFLQSARVYTLFATGCTATLKDLEGDSGLAPSLRAAGIESLLPSEAGESLDLDDSEMHEDGQGA